MNPISEEEYFYEVDNMVFISCQHLRTLFQARWKKECGLDWEQSENQGHDFIKGLGQVAYEKAMNAQKVILSKGRLEDWDISLLSMVLLNFGDWRSYKAENVAVRQLTTLRNEMAHHPSKKLSLEEYNVKVASFRVSMQGVGVNNEEIEKAIKNAGRSSSVAALKSTKRLYDRARGLMKNNKYEHAIGCYAEAITMPSLLPIHQATAYEKRAECYLKFAQYKKEKHLRAEVDDCCNQALKDAARALEINDKSWQAHFTMAQAHRLKGDLRKAVEHCQQSLAISAVEQQVKNELASCKSLLLIKEGDNSHLESSNLPMSLAEEVALCSINYGRKITEEEFIETMGVPKEVADKVPGYNFLVRAHQYRCGWGVRPNEVEAVQFFAKSAETGYAEGILSLAVAYMNGVGVAQDASKAFELFLQAAQMSPDSPGQETNAGNNIGVANAQFYLGTMYETGLVVETDYVQAANWYRKSAENGFGSAAFRLGVFYMNGLGVPRNQKLAVLQWSQALRFGYGEAAYSLVLHYKQNLEPEKSLSMFKAGREMGVAALLGMSEDEFMVEFRDDVKKRDWFNPIILAFENQHRLEAKGLTFMERMRRVKNVSNGKPATFSTADTPTNSKDLRDCFIKPETIQAWETAAGKGSTVAAGLLTSLELGSRVLQLITESELSKEEKAVKMQSALYDFLTNEYVVGTTFPDSFLPSIKKAVEDLFKSQHGKKGEMDMMARLCFVTVNLKIATGKNIARGIELLKEGITMYPENVHYYIQLTRLYDTIKDRKAGLTIVKKGLEKHPDNLKLLVFKAVFLTETSSNPYELEKAIDANNEFLSKAPINHPEVPGAYYSIAMLTISASKLGKAALPSDKLRIETYYNLGTEAEEKALILPDNGSPSKAIVESFLGLLEPDTETKALSQSQGEDKIVAPASTIIAQQQVVDILQRKSYLDSPIRKTLMLSHRQLIKSMILLKLPIEAMVSFLGDQLPEPRMTQSAPKGLSQLKPLTLAQMNPMKEDIYQNCSIDLTIIDEPNIKQRWVQLVAEDENGDPVFVFIHKMDRTLANFGRLKFGRRISILNPYMQVRNSDLEIGIRVDDRDCLVYLGGVENMCRFCGEENAKLSCGKCKKAMYCSKKCQVYDCKMMQHKLICSHIKNSIL